jgi:iron complex outermembrane recepter protein
VFVILFLNMNSRLLPKQFLWYIIPLFLIFISSPVIFAQEEARITGTIVDGRSGDPLEFSNISVMSVDDSTMVAGGVTDLDGQFELSVPPGDYLLRVGFIGFDDLWEPVSLTAGTNYTGNLALYPASELLDEVVVEAAASLFRTEFDRRIFTLEGTTVADGGTALQVLETLPSIQVDEEGNLTMRGSGNVQIYINGRPTNLSSDDTESVLEQYPADAIESVELITNPSARFDAEGTGGIINLVLREEGLQGFNGQVNTSAGTGNKYTMGLNVNYRGNRFNVFTGYSYQYRELWEENVSFRQYFGEGVNNYLDQDYYTSNWRQGHLLRTGVEYEINPQSSVRLFSNLNLRSRDRERIYNIRNLDSNQQLDSLLVRLLEEDQARQNYEFGVNYGWQAASNNGQRLDARISFSLDEQDRIEYFDQDFFDSANQPVPGNRRLQTYERPRKSTLLLATLDYRLPLGEDRALEAGLRSNIRHWGLEQIFQNYDFDDQQYVVDDLITNQFDYDRNIYAGYLIFQDRFGAFSYQAGLRGEFTDATSFQPAIDSTYRDQYFNLFPSLFLNYEITTNQDVQVNYSRRVRRPRTGALMPFVNAQDFYNLRIGNPYLNAAYTNSFELSYLRGWESYFLSASAYYRHTENAISRVFELFDERYAIVTWINSDTRRNLGLELVNQFNFTQNMDATLTGNFFHSEISGTNVDGSSFVSSRFSWTMSLLGNMRIPNLFNVQVMGNYRGPIAVPQGSIKPVYSMNLGLRRNIWQQNATISFNVSDIFNSRRFVLETDGAAFGQERRFMRESRVFTLSLTYRFGGYRDRETTRSNGNGMDGEDGLY